MKILVIGDPHGCQKYKKSVLNKADLTLITGDIGKADIARKRCSVDIERKRKGLPEIEHTSKQEREGYMEIYNSSIGILKHLSKFAPVYTILGNVGTSTDYEMKKEEKKLGIKLPYMRSSMKKIKDLHLVRNGVRKIDGLRIGFLEYFVDSCWVREFKPSDYKNNLKKAKKETDKARRILKNFGTLDILLCHQPPYRILDKMMNKKGPKHWYGKHAGSKVILDYVKKMQPRYVFCGHIHEAKGKKKIGKTEVYNVGCCGDYVSLDIE